MTVATLPPIVWGVPSPNPTVVMVIKAYHMVSSILLTFGLIPCSKK